MTSFKAAILIVFAFLGGTLLGLISAPTAVRTVTNQACRDALELDSQLLVTIGRTIQNESWVEGHAALRAAEGERNYLVQECLGGSEL